MKTIAVCKAWIVVLAGVLSAATCVAAEWHVSPQGSHTGNGSAAQPWDLATALNQPSVVGPGDTIWLHGGTYGQGGDSRFVSRLSGREGRPVTVRQAVGERAIVNAGIQTDGSFVWWWGFEITNTNSLRRNDQVHRPTGINTNGRADGNNMINLIIYNVGHPGIGYWNQSTKTCTGEIYGCIVFANGLGDVKTPPGNLQKPWIRGSGTYTQNEAGTTVKIHDSIWFWNFTTGINAYGEGGSVKGYDVRGNIGFDSKDRDLWFATIPPKGQPNPIEQLVVIGNCTWTGPETGNKGGAQAGYKGSHKDALFQDNYIVGGHNGTDPMVFLRSFEDVNFVGNTVVGPGVLVGDQVSQGVTQKAIWDRNTYHGGQKAAGKPFGYNLEKQNLYTFAQWQKATGFDAHSTCTEQYPQKNVVKVFPNRYEPGRAHVAIYNWERADRVAVDLSKVGLNKGEAFEVRDVQDLFGKPLVSATYTGAPVQIPTQHDAKTAITPIMGSDQISHVKYQHTPKEFGVFLVLKTIAPAKP